MELGIDVGDDIGNEWITLEMKPGDFIVICSDKGYANYTTNFGGGTIDRYESVRVRNLSTETAAVVKMFAAGRV